MRPLNQKCPWVDGCITPSPKVEAERLHYPTHSHWSPTEDGCITPSPKVKAEWLHYPTPSLWGPRGDGCIFPSISSNSFHKTSETCLSLSSNPFQKTCWSIGYFSLSSRVAPQSGIYQSIRRHAPRTPGLGWCVVLAYYIALRSMVPYHFAMLFVLVGKPFNCMYHKRYTQHAVAC